MEIEHQFSRTVGQTDNQKSIFLGRLCPLFLLPIVQANQQIDIWACNSILAMLMRSFHPSPVAFPTLFALRQSLIASFNLPSHKKPKSIITRGSSLPLPRGTRVSFPVHLRSSSVHRNPALMADPRFKGRGASFATGCSSDDGGGVGSSREILVQHLLVRKDDMNLMLELQKRALAGEDLSDLALEYSICPSKENGGMLGWVRKGQMVPEFEDAAYSAPLNKVVRCKTQFGWHLLQVLSEREEPVLQDIQPDDLHAKLQDPAFLDVVQLIDVREPEEVDQASLPQFQVLPLRQFGKWGPEITTKFDHDKETYVLCHHGMRSLQVAKWLQSQGFKKVFNVAGGIHAYAVKVDPSIPTY